MNLGLKYNLTNHFLKFVLSATVKKKIYIYEKSALKVSLCSIHFSNNLK